MDPSSNHYGGMNSGNDTQMSLPFSNAPPEDFENSGILVDGYSNVVNQAQNSSQIIVKEKSFEEVNTNKGGTRRISSIASDSSIVESDDPYQQGFVESYVDGSKPTQPSTEEKKVEQENEGEKEENGLKKIQYSNPQFSHIEIPNETVLADTNNSPIASSSIESDVIQEPIEVDGEMQPKEYLVTLAEQNDGVENEIEEKPEGEIEDGNPQFRLQPGENDRCRFCSSGESTGQLIAPCRCTGKMTWVHRKCLDRWRVMSIHSKSFSRCDSCNFKYEFENGGRCCPSPFAFGKCTCLMCCDFSYICCCWCTIITISSLLTWAAFGPDGLQNFLIFALLPDIWIFDLMRYVIFGHVWVFIILGVIALCVFFVSMIFRCQRTRSKDFHYYGRYRALRLTYFDYLCVWYMIHMGMCDCNSLYLLGGIDACALSVLACGFGACRAKGGGGGKSSGIEQLMLLVLLFVLCTLMTIGIIFGSIFLAYLTYVIITRRIRIVMRSDRVKKNIVVDQTRRKEGDDVFTLDEEEGEDELREGEFDFPVYEEEQGEQNEEQEQEQEQFSEDIVVEEGEVEEE